MEINFDKFGFELIEKKHVTQTGCEGFLLSHKKNGARLLLLPCEDDNKMFGIGFKTPVNDDTGVPHIVEHCVLSGSRKYHTREPFMDLLKTSQKTYLNAMTFSDKTVYPIATKNEKDFYNLVDVYLDAVFYPAIYTNKNIFLQEGWHYELDENDKLIVNGVVYNEMRGYYSSPETEINYQIMQSLHADGSYAYESGGYPESVPNLSYDNFLAFHKKYYHPSNSYICAYGNLDYEAFLKYLNEEYLSHFERSDIDSSIKKVKLDEPVRSSYPINASDDGSEKQACFSYNVMLDYESNTISSLTRTMLMDLLMESNSAPLKKALIEKNICDDCFSMSYANDTTELSFVAKNADEKSFDEFVNTINDELSSIVRNKIPTEQITACLNKIEFSLKEVFDYKHRGKALYLDALSGWLYGKSPFEALSYIDEIKFLREQIGTDYYENLISEKLINNPHKSILLHYPVSGLNKERDEQLQAKLAKLKQNMTSEELTAIKAEHETLLAYQMTDDTEEQKATIPTLSLSDVNKTISHIEAEIKNLDGITQIYNPFLTNGIVYADIVFDIKNISRENLLALSIASELLTQISTEKYDYEQLSTELDLHLGGIHISPTITVPLNNETKVKLILSAKFKIDELENFVSLSDEVLKNSNFNDKKRIKNLLTMIKTRMEQAIQGQAHVLASNRASSYIDCSAMMNEYVKGIECYKYVCNVLKDFDNKFEELSKVFASSIINAISEPSLIHFTCDTADESDVSSSMLKFAKSLYAGSAQSVDFDYSEEILNEGLITPGNVQFVAQSGKLNAKYDASLLLLTQILNNDYLHSNVRAKGGAYGVGISFNRSSMMALHSYMDPQLKETLKAYKNMPEFIKNLNISEEELTNYKIGTLSEFDPPLTASGRGKLSMIRYLLNVDEKLLNDDINAILNTDLKKLQSYGDIIKDALDKNAVTVIGSETKITSDANALNKIEKLF